MKNIKLIKQIGCVKIYQREHKEFPFVTIENDCEATMRRFANIDGAINEAEVRNMTGYKYFC